MVYTNLIKKLEKQEQFIQQLLLETKDEKDKSGLELDLTEVRDEIHCLRDQISGPLD